MELKHNDQVSKSRLLFYKDVKKRVVSTKATFQKEMSLILQIIKICLLLRPPQEHIY